MRQPQYGGCKSLSVINCYTHFVSAIQELLKHGYEQSLVTKIVIKQYAVIEFPMQLILNTMNDPKPLLLNGKEIYKRN